MGHHHPGVENMEEFYDFILKKSASIIDLKHVMVAVDGIDSEDDSADGL